MNGLPSAAGKYVLISIGMSNTTQEWCSQSSAPPCAVWTLMGRASADLEVNRSNLVIVNGAAAGQVADTWSAPTAANYDRIRDVRLGPLGLGEKQVQAAWVKLAAANPRVGLPADSANARVLFRQLGEVTRSLKTRYPNLQLVFFSSRIYAGYATTQLSPEPFAYEEGFSVKWLIDAQIAEARGNPPNATAGTLSYAAGAAAWLVWGPYLWANGTSARSDGLSWSPADFQGDGTHPSQSGESKVGAMLLAFFKTSPYTRCWFLAGQICS